MQTSWSHEAEEALKFCLVSSVEEVLCGEDTHSPTHCIADCINFCVVSVVATRIVQCFSYNKPWISPDIRALLKQKQRAPRSGSKWELKDVHRELRRKAEKLLQEEDGGFAANEQPSLEEAEKHLRS